MVVIILIIELIYFFRGKESKSSLPFRSELEISRRVPRRNPPALLQLSVMKLVYLLS
jgi:hypothetical protein